MVSSQSLPSGNTVLNKTANKALSLTKWLVGLCAVGVIGCAIVLLATMWPTRILSDDGPHRSPTVSGLVCEESLHDFGRLTLKQAIEVDHVFMVTNTSPHAIRVLKQTSSCGCTLAEIPKEPIPSGGRIPVRLKADWAGRAGPQSAIVALTTDSPKTPTVQLAIRGFVLTPALVVPNHVNFGVLKSGEEVSRVVVARGGTDPKPFRVTEMHASTPFVSITRMGTGAGGGHSAPGDLTEQFILTATNPGKTLRVEGQITLRTDLPELPQLLLTVEADLRGPLVALPQSVLFGPFKGEATAYQAIRIRHSLRGAKPAAEFLWNSSAECPFYIERMTTVPNVSEDEEAVIRIGFDRGRAREPIVRATLKVIVGSSSLEIPVLGIGKQ